MRLIFHPTNFRQVQKAVGKLRREMEEALWETDGDLLFCAPPGSGKTAAILKWCMELVKAGGAAVYSVPTHKLAQELRNKVVGVGATILEGRNEKNCRLFSQAKELIDRGYFAKLLCRVCPYESDCPYWLKLKKAMESPSQIVFCTPMLLSLAVEHWPGARAVIVDERVEAFLRFEEVPSVDLLRLGEEFELELPRVLVKHASKMAEHIKEERLAFLNSRAEGRHSLWNFLGKIGLDIQALRDELEQRLQSIGNLEKNYDLLWVWYERGLSLRAFYFLQALLEGRAYILIARRQARFSYYQPPTIPPQVRLIVADYSADKQVVTRLFGRKFKVVSGKVPLHYPVCLAGGSTSKTKLDRSPEVLERLIKAAEAVVRGLPPGRYLVFGFKKHLPRIREKLDELKPTGVELSYANHFGRDSRGLNTFQNYNGVLVLARPIEAPWGWLPRFDALGIPVEEVGSFLHDLSYKETVQEICRLRPHLQERARSIWLIGNFTKTDLKRHLDARVEGGLVLSPLGLLVKLAEACLESLGFADPLLLSMLGVNPPDLETRKRFWNQAARRKPDLISKLSLHLQNLYQREGVSISILFHSPDGILNFIYPQVSVVPRNTLLAQINDMQGFSQDASVEQHSPTLYKICEQVLHSPTLYKKNENFHNLPEPLPLVLQSWPVEIRYCRNWWGKVRGFLAPKHGEFPIQRRSGRGMTSTYALGNEQAFEEFYVSLGLWGNEIRAVGKGVQFYVGMVEGSDE